MLHLSPEDNPLQALVGAEIPSNYSEHVSYHVGRSVGEGGMSVAYLALRVAPEGNAPVVIKILRPRFVRRFGETASLIVQKEAVALGRLNERVPATPFVVRLIDVGCLQIRQGEGDYELPWIVVEYVHGGAEGTTLADRVAHSLEQTASAFDPLRAAHAIECLCKGVAAVHEVGVIHRDLKPENVLCCGYGHDEIFKVADFGVARPLGVTATFGGTSIGTPGYAAPELIVMDQRTIGPWSDVFGLAAVVFFLLTGEPYFPVQTITEAVLQIQDRKRRSLLETAGLSRELRDRPAACRAIDQALARATSASPKERPHDAETLAASLLPWLRTDARQLWAVPRRFERAAEQPAPGWTWITRQQAGDDQVIRSVAWDGDGRCLAATNRGLVFWSGTRWENAPVDGLPDPSGIRFVHRIGAGRWLVGCDEATFAIYTAEGTRDVLRLKTPWLQVQLFSGNLEDVGIIVSRDEHYTTTLNALVGKHWLKPLPLPHVAAITSASRMGDACWLLAGRSTNNQGFAALYYPLDWEVRPLSTPLVRAFLSCAGQAEIEAGVVAGADGVVVCCDEQQQTWVETVDGGQDISAVVLDAAGCCWAGGAGRLWYRPALDSSNRQRAWTSVWNDPNWNAPIVSMFADIGLIIGVTADGAIVEGRSRALDFDTLLHSAPTHPLP